MINTSKLTDYLRDAIMDYASNAEGKNASEWLQGYLSTKMAEQSSEVINAISSTIIATISVMEQSKSSLNAAIESGESAEIWFAKEAMNNSGGNGQSARTAAEFLNGITSAGQSIDNTLKGEIIDVESEEWNDKDWNHFKLKDSLKSVAAEAGQAGLREIASDAFQKASEEGISAVMNDSDFILSSLEKCTITGLKTAISAGLAVAEDKEILPPTGIEIIATTAHRTVEDLTVISDVIRGKKTMTEAMIHIKNTAVSTLKGMWQQHCSGVLNNVKEKVTAVFGIKGAVISGAITGIVTPPQEGSKLKHILKEAGKSVVKFLQKEVHLPFFNKNKRKQLSMN